MTPEQAINIITNEELYINNYNWFVIQRITMDEIAIIKDKDKFKVYIASERGGADNVKVYNNVDDALTDFIERLRNNKQMLLARFEKFDSDDKKISQEEYLYNLREREGRHKLKREEWLHSKNRIYEIISRT